MKLTPTQQQRARHPQPRIKYSMRHCTLILGAPQMRRHWQAVACPRAAHKTGTYRSLRYLQVAASVPSAGRIHSKSSCVPAVAIGNGVRASALCLRRPSLLSKGEPMQIPAILKGESRTRLLQGIAIGAIATVVIGFYWGGWVTNGMTSGDQWPDVCPGTLVRRTIRGG